MRARAAAVSGVAATVAVASVWLVHGLYNKLLDGAPRHLAIVQAVPGLEGAAGERVLMATGVFEVIVAVWVLSGRAAYLCAGVQTSALVAMNIVELTFSRHLLLWPAGLLPVNLVFLGIAWYAASARRAVALRTRLRRHPIPIEAHLEDCLTLTYAVPPDVLRPLLPPGLELETHAGHGFVAVALVRARSLRPAGLPRAAGQDFFLAGYRIFTRFQPEGRGAIRGLRILRSDTDCARMVAGGNLLTHYNYHRCSARICVEQDRLRAVVTTPDGGGELDVTAHLKVVARPNGSPFGSVPEARRFAGPLPFTFDYEADTHSIVAIQATRTNWRPVPVAVDVRRISFFERPAFAGCQPLLAAAFYVAGIDYRWERGVLHRLGQDVTGGAR